MSNTTKDPLLRIMRRFMGWSLIEIEWFEPVFLSAMCSPGFHAWFHLHRFVGARDHSHKHLSGLWVVLSLQVFIHTVLYVHSQSCRLEPYGAQRETSNLLTFSEKRKQTKENHKNCLVWDHESLDLLTAYAIKVIRSQGQQTPKNENTNETTRPTSIKQSSHCRKATERDICTPCAGGGGFDYFVSSVLARQKLQYIWNSKCRDVNWRLAENLFSFRVFALFFKQLSQMNLKRESEMSQNFVRQLTQLKYAQSNQGRCWRLTRMAKWPRSVRRKSGASSVHSLYIQQTWRRTSTR